MTGRFTYHTFGLNIQSDFEIPELPEKKFDTADVEISYGENPVALTNPRGKGVLYQAKKDDFLFRLDTVGSYRVQEGNKITVERLNSATDEEIRLFLLGSAFGAMIQQRDLLPFHGSTVVKDNKAYVIGGVSGAGKSSLAATLVKRGYSLLADDISVIRTNKEKVMVCPGIPHLKLWEDVMKKLEEDLTLYPKVRPQLLKYRKPAGPEFTNQSTELHSIHVLSSKNTPGFETEAVKGVEKFNLLKNNTYRYQYLDGLEKTVHHFRLTTDIAARSRVYRLKRPSSPLLLNELADYFEEEIVRP
ncbi:MAG: hypothetical protein K9G38_06670 [Bacteroidales bacterium]|nr:hypothetical protein [Bacteroidales bacterium]